MFRKLGGVEIRQGLRVLEKLGEGSVEAFGGGIVVQTGDQAVEREHETLGAAGLKTRGD